MCIHRHVTSHIFLVPSPIKKFLGYFHILAMVNNISVNTVSLWHTDFIFSVYTQKMIHGSNGNCIFNFLRKDYVVFPYQFINPAVVHRAPFFLLSPHQPLSFKFLNGHPKSCEVIFTVVSFAFLWVIAVLGIFSSTLWTYINLLWKNVYSWFLSIFKSDF